MTVLRAGLIGGHISRTRLPAALDIICAMHGWTLDFELIDTATRADFDFADTVENLRAAGWTGVTVTHPYKTQAAAWAGDGMLPELRGLGASNTLVFGPPVSAHNSDFTGFIGAWKAQAGQDPGRVAIAGAGGVARALGPALARLGASDIAVWDMDTARAADLVARIGPVARFVAIEDAAGEIAAADGLVNATPMGMREYPGSAFDAALLGPQSWAFDAVYTPTETGFLIAARRAGMQVITGFSLFQHMALGTFEAYTGITPDPVATLAELDSLRPE